MLSLEGVVATVLSRFLGDFVQGLEKENLKLSLTSGQVSLKNLALRKEALANLQLPVVVKEGFLGSLELSIPWKNLGSQPAIIKLDRIYLIAGPAKIGDEDPAIIEERLQNTKQKRLMLAELMGSDEKKEETKGTEKKEPGWAQKWVAKVVDNIQIFVDRVHIRYEDDRTCPASPFVFGITLESLHAQSTTEDWTPTFLNTSPTLVHKLVSLKNLTVYWDSSGSFVDAVDLEDLSDQMDALTHQDYQNLPPRHHYLLRPINSELKVVLNKNDADLSIPKILLNFMFEKVAFTLEENQFGEIMGAVDSFALFHRGIKYRSMRPTVPVTKDVQAWWQFAVNATVMNTKEKKRLWSMEFITQAIKDRKQYVLVYTKKKQYEDQRLTFPKEDEAELAELEMRLTYEQIIAFRQLANAFVKKERALLEASGKKSGGGGWFSSWFRSNTLETSGLELTQELMKELYEEIDAEEAKKAKPSSVLPKEFVKVRIGFQLEEGSLEMKTSAGKETISLAQAVFKGFDLNLAIREGSMSFNGTLKTAGVYDYYTPNTRFPALISPVATEEQETDHVLGIGFDLNPIDDSNIDLRVKLQMQPLEIILNMILVNRIIKFFTNQKETSALRNLQQEALRQFDALQKQSFEQLTWTLQNKKVLDIHVEAAAPSILVPQSFVDDNCNMLVIDLGHVSVNTRLSGDEKEKNARLARIRPGDLENSIHEIREEDFYDKLFVNLASLQALIAHKSEDWRHFLPERRKTAQIIDRFDVELCLQLCLVPSDVLTKVKLSGKLPSLHLNVSDNRCKELFKTLKAVLKSLSDGGPKPETPRALQAPQSDSEDFKKAQRHLLDTLTPEEEKLRAQNQIALMAKKVVELYFVIPDIRLIVTEEKGGSESGLATLCLQNIIVTVIKRTFDLTAIVVLHEVVVEDFLQNWGEKFRYLLSSDLATSSDPILQLAYRNVNKESPEYAAVDQDLDLRLGNLGIICNRETLVSLLHFVNRNIVDQLQDMPTEPSSTTSENLEIAKQQEAAKNGGSAINLNLRIGTVKLSLNKNGSFLSELLLDRSSIKLQISPKGTIHIAGKLGSIAVHDSCAENKYYANVVKIESEKEKGARLVTFAFDTYDIKDATTYPGYDLAVQMNVSSIGLVFVQPFFRDLLVYLTEIKAMQDLLAKSAAAAAEGAKQAAQKVMESVEEVQKGQVVDPTQKAVGKLFHFDITVLNPHVIIPRNTQSEDVLVLNLGNIHLANKFDRVAGGGKEDATDLFEIITLSIRELNIQATQLQHTDDASRQQQQQQKGKAMVAERYAKVVRDINLDISLERAMQNIGHDFVDQKITINVSHIDFVIVEQKMYFLLSILGDNFAVLFGKEGILAVLKNLGDGPDKEKEKEKEEKTKQIEGAPSAPQDSAIWTTMAVEVVLDRLSVDVLRGDGLLRKPKPGLVLEEGQQPREEDMVVTGDSTLVSLTVHSVRVQYVQKSDSSMTCDVYIENLNLEDARADCDNKFKQLVGRISKEEVEELQQQAMLAAFRKPAKVKDNKLIRVRYDKEQPSGYQSITVVVDRPRVYVIPKPLLALKDLVLPLVDALLATLAKMNPDAEQEKEKLKEIDKPDTPPSSTGITGGNLVPPVGIRGAKGPLALKLVVTNPEICVLESPEQEDSRGLMVRAKIDVSYLTLDPIVGGGQKARVLMRSFELCKRRFSCNELKAGWCMDATSVVLELADKDTEVSLLEPLDMQLCYSQVNYPAEMCEVVIEVQRVYVTLSIQDYKLLMNLVDIAMEVYQEQLAKEPAAETIEETEQPSPDVAAKGDDNMQENFEKEQELQLHEEERRMKMVPIKHQSSVQLLKPQKQSLQLLSGGVVLNFLNDFMGQNTPLIEVEVDKSKVTVSDWSNLLSAFVDTHLHANYYNAKRETWEPMLEQWHFLLKFAKHNSGQRLNLRADSSLELNVTRAFVETLMNTLEVWNDQSFDQLAITSLVHYPYYIKNETGQLLKYWISTEASNIFELKPGEEQPLPIASKPVKIRRLENARSRVDAAFLSVQIEGFKPLRDLVIDQYGTEELSVGNLKLLKHIIYKRGSTLIKLQSTVKVKNRTQVPIEVFVDVAEAGEVHTPMRIEPRTEIQVPLHLSANSRLQFKPVLEEAKGSRIALGASRKSQKPRHYDKFLVGAELDGVKWTSQKLYSSKLTKISGMMMCDLGISAMKDPFLVAFAFRVDVDRVKHLIKKEEERPPSEGDEKPAEEERDSASRALVKTTGKVLPLPNLFQSAKKEGPRHHVIELFPPFVLQNLLACDIDFKIIVPNNKHKDVEVMVGVIQEGSKVNVHIFEEEKPVYASIRLPGFCWSDPIPIKANVPDYIDIKDQEKRVLRLHADEKIRTSGVHMISFWCDYWMINKTGLRLLYKQETTLSYVPLVAGQYSNTPFYDRRLTSRPVGLPTADSLVSALSSLGNRSIEELTKNNWDSSLESSTEEIWDLKGEPRDWYYADYQTIYQQPFMLAFSHTGLTAPKIQVRIANSGWSDGISLSGQNSIGTFEVPDRENIKPPKMFHLGLESAAASGKFWRTKCITIVPVYMLVNTLPMVLFINQIGTSETFSLLPGETLPFHWYVTKHGKHLRIRLEDPRYDWSGAFELKPDGTESLKLLRNDKSIENLSLQERQLFLRMETKAEDAKNFVFFKTESTKYPKYRINNKTNRALMICQKGLEKQAVKMPPRSSMPFAWDEPTVEEKLLVMKIDKINVQQEYNINHFFDNKPIVLSSKGHDEEIFVSTYASGPTRVLLIRDKGTRDKESLKLIEERRGAGERVRAGQKGRNTAGKQEDEQLATEINLSFAGVGISLIDDTPQELLYLSLEGINIDLVISDKNQYFEVTIAKAQADNMLYSTIYPIMVYPNIKEVKSEEDAEVGLRSFMHLSVVKRVDMEEVDFFQYFGFGVQELDIQVEGEFLARFLEFVNVINNSSVMQPKEPLQLEDAEVRKQQLVAKEKAQHELATTDKDKDKGKDKEKGTPKDIRVSVRERRTSQAIDKQDEIPIEWVGLELFRPSAKISAESKPLYFGVFHLNPISILLTFTPISGVRSDITISRVLNFTGAIENAPIKLNMLGLENAFMPRADFIARIQAHYTQQALAQIYKVLGSYEFMGSPVSLVSNLGSGVYDFFYEPANGLVKSPQAFGEGLAKGTESLFRNTLTGIFNSTSKITGSISKGAATLSFDPEYIKQREQAQRSRPKHALEGLSSGVSSFGKGLFHGATGIVMQPVKGAKEEGITGFAKGVGRGIVGVAAKPVAGTFDMFSQTTEGFRNTATYLDRGNRTRVRAPRYIGEDKVLRPYDPELAEGKTLLYMANGGEHKNEHYQFHFRDTKGNVVLVSDSNIVYVDGSDDTTILWTIEFRNYDHTELTEGGLWIHMKQAGSASLKEFVGGGVTKRFIPGGDKFTIDKFHHQLERVTAEHGRKLEKKSSILTSKNFPPATKAHK